MNLISAHAVNAVSYGVTILAAPAPAPADPANPGFDPNTVPITPPPGVDKILNIVGWMRWGGALVAFVGILWLGFRIIGASASSRGGHGLGSAAGYVALGMIIIGSAASILSFFL